MTPLDHPALDDLHQRTTAMLAAIEMANLLPRLA